MGKRTGSTVQFPKMIGPSDSRLEMNTAELNEEINGNFEYLVRKQQKIRAYLGPLIQRKQRTTTTPVDGAQLPDAVIDALTKCENLARLSETRLKSLRYAIKTRNGKVIESIELGKSAIIREVVQARRTKVNWFGPNMIVTPLDESISERQCLIGDFSDDILELERALAQPMDI